MKLSDRLKSDKTENKVTEEKRENPQPVETEVEREDGDEKFKEYKSQYVNNNNAIFKAKLQNKILKNIENFSLDNLENKVNSIAVEILNEHKELLDNLDMKKIVKEIIENITGFGPINSFVLDEDITEIMVNGYKNIYVEKAGKLIKTDVSFRNDNHVMQIIDKIVEPLGRRIDESSPMVDARLPDGSRVNAIIPPLAINGPTLTIRKFSKEPYNMNDFIDMHTLSREMAAFIDLCVRAKLNIFISGGTGSGKTTTLNVVSSFIDEKERIVTIEDAAELKLWQEHVVSLESRPPNIEGEGQITIRDLVRNSLRMRPDRIIVGEVRGNETIDMLQAMNTGHDGSMATGHANSPRDMLSRLETMILMSGVELPIKVIRSQIARAINIVIHQTRFKDGTRKITSISEVQGLEEDVIIMQDIFKYQADGTDKDGKILGDFKLTGIRPYILKTIEAKGIEIPDFIFAEEGEF